MSVQLALYPSAHNLLLSFSLKPCRELQFYLSSKYFCQKTACNNNDHVLFLKSCFFKNGKPGTHGSPAQKPVAITSGKSEKGGVYQPHKNKRCTQILNT